MATELKSFLGSMHIIMFLHSIKLSGQTVNVCYVLLASEISEQDTLIGSKFAILYIRRYVWRYVCHHF